MFGSGVLLVDFEGSTHQRLGLGQTVGGLKQLSEVVEHNCECGRVFELFRLVNRRFQLRL